jgi:hypothetical protein
MRFRLATEAGSPGMAGKPARERRVKGEVMARRGDHGRQGSGGGSARLIELKCPEHRRSEGHNGAISLASGQSVSGRNRLAGDGPDPLIGGSVQPRLRANEWRFTDSRRIRRPVRFRQGEAARVRLRADLRIVGGLPEVKGGGGFLLHGQVGALNPDSIPMAARGLFGQSRLALRFPEPGSHLRRKDRRV